MMKRRIMNVKMLIPEEMIRKAMDHGVKIVACTMSMDVMGIRRKSST